MAGDASGAGLVKSRALVEPSCRNRINAEAFHHAIHQLGLLQDPVQHWTAIAKVAHGESSSVGSNVRGRGRALFDLGQMRLRPIAQKLGPELARFAAAFGLLREPMLSLGRSRHGAPRCPLSRRYLEAKLHQPASALFPFMRTRPG
jgi:hypothetical protein